VAIGGITGATHWFGHYFAHTPGMPETETHGFELALMVASGLVAIAGIALAYFVYGRGARPAARATGWQQPFYQLSLNKFYLDEIYWAVIVAPLRGAARLAVWFDNNVIDRAVDLAGSLPRLASAAPRLLHEGVVSSYALMMWVGVLFCMLAATRLLW
jgi:NADH-quinone oxidoreductase subunit L